jgi:hypothetical protein
MTAGPALTGPDAFHRVAQVLVDAVAARLHPPPGRACVVPGEIAWDACDCDGMVAASVARLYLTSSFPAEASAGITSPCDAADLAADIVLEVVRCAPTPDAEGNPPGCAELTSAAVQVAIDAWEARLAAWCALRDLRTARRIEGFRVAAQPTLGPQGGCVATRLPVTVAVAGGCGCED